MSEEEDFEIESILYIREILDSKTNDHLLYHVKWKGYNEETDEPESHLNCPERIDDFLKHSPQGQELYLK